MALTGTAKERREAAEQRAAEYWHSVFRHRMAQLPSLAAARALADEHLADGHPGRRFHENLARFLEHFEVPPSANLGERLALMTLVRRGGETGELTAAEVVVVEERFRRAPPPVR